MKKSILLCLLSLPALGSPAQDTERFAGAAGNDSIHVRFVLYSPDLSSDTTVFITGSIGELANWVPGTVRMSCSGPNQWKKEISVEAPVTLEYKYTLGSWEREGAQPSGRPLSNFHARVSRDTVIHDTIYFWTKPGRSHTVTHTVTGTLLSFPAMKGPGIAPRDVLVWLPPGYGENKKTRYAVLYMHDGQNLFDAATSAFGAEWRVDETADSLIRTGAIPSLIIVGICNTPDRSAEYSPGEKGSAYMNFIVHILKPFIDSAFQTLPGRKHTAVAGSSMGGLISFMLAWEYPQVFSTAICMSPALKISTYDYVSVVNATTGKKKPVFIYMDNGGVGLEKELQPGIDAMAAVLRNKGYREGRDFVFLWYPDEKHFESDWAKRLPQAIVMIMGK